MCDDLGKKLEYKYLLYIYLYFGEVWDSVVCNKIQYFCSIMFPFFGDLWSSSHEFGQWDNASYPLVNIYKKLLKMAIEIVDFPIKNGDFPLLC